jgi:hypothetical protein
MDPGRLPYAKQLSPNQIDLRVLLDLLSAAGGDRVAFQTAVGKRFFPKRDPKNQFTSAMNTFLSMRAHGLVAGNDPYTVTDLAIELRREPTDSALEAAFAKHLLLNLNGLQLLEVIESLEARGQTVTVARIVDELLALGIDPGGSSGENLNPMKLWLERAHVLNGWTIDSAVLKQLTGASITEVSELVSMPAPQQAFLRALATVTDPPPHDAAGVRRLAEMQSPGLRFDTKTFSKDVVERLDRDGWIALTKATGGRGAKSHRVTPTKRFQDVVSEPLLQAVVEQTHLQDPASLRRPLADLLGVVEDVSLSNHDRGLALEGVCIQVARLTGARFLSWRLRGDETAGAEVDVVAETMQPPYLLVQLQSKASAISGREIIDREVGVAATLKSNVLLFVTAKTVGPAARKAAATHMQESGLSILFLDGSDLKKANAGAGIGDALAREWQRVATVRSRRGRDRAQALRD